MGWEIEGMKTNDAKSDRPIWEWSSQDPARWLPIDLTALVPANTLIRWILELQPENLNQRIKPVNLTEKGFSAIQPSALFTLLAYCYSTGLFASSEIEGRVESDKYLKYICAHSLPDESEIRRFRRVHSEAIVTCLAGILHRAYEEKFRESERLDFPSGQSCSLVENSPSARLKMHFQVAARKRFMEAVQLDSMALDV